MNDNAIVPAGEVSYLAPVVGVQGALESYQVMKEFVEKVLRKDVDFGEIPGTTKDTLYKPGAEKLARLFGLTIRLPKELQEAVRDWSGNDHGGEPFFYFSYTAQVRRGDLVIAECEASCNSWEGKYRYRKSSRVCPACKQETIIKGKSEYGGGWLCWKKNGGCGAKFQDGDPVIEEQEVGQVPNPNIADQVNTFQKMAQKRAIVGAVLLACNASEYFTQDLEDFLDGEVVEVNDNGNAPKDAPPEKVKAQTASKPRPKKVKNFGSRQWDSDTIAAVKESGEYAAGQHVVAILNLSHLPASVGADVAVQWEADYRKARDNGSEKEAAAKSADDAFEARLKEGLGN